MLGDWLRAGNQVWLGKYWDSRTGGGLQRGERAQVRRERCEPGESHIPTQPALGHWRRMSNSTQWSLWLPDTRAPYPPQVDRVYRDWGSLALLDTGHDLLPTNRGVQNKCSNICLGSGLFWNLCFLLIIQKQETEKPIYSLNHLLSWALFQD